MKGGVSFKGFEVTDQLDLGVVMWENPISKTFIIWPQMRENCIFETGKHN